MKDAPDECWVSCATCSAAVRTRAQLIRHVELTHMGDAESATLPNLERAELLYAQKDMRKTSCSQGWTEHMFVDRTVLRCKGVVGRPYYQCIDNNKRKVQKLCPATSIVGEPRNGKYTLQLYWRHCGHASAPFGASVNSIDQRKGDQIQHINNTLVAIKNVVASIKAECLDKIVEKVENLENFVIEFHQDNNKTKATKVAEPAKKKRRPEPVKSDEVDKAVDEALERYIKSHNPMIKLEEIRDETDQPKIVNTFSLKTEDLEIDEFVKDVELLVNNGKTYEAAENRSKLGHVGEEIKLEDKWTSETIAKNGNPHNDNVTRDCNMNDNNSSASSMTKLDNMNPVVRMEDWENSSFNDTYKAFLTRECKTELLVQNNNKRSRYKINNKPLHSSSTETVLLKENPPKVKAKVKRSSSSVHPKSNVQKEKSKLKRQSSAATVLPKIDDQKAKRELKRYSLPASILPKTVNHKEKSKLKRQSLLEALLTKDCVQKEESKLKRNSSLSSGFLKNDVDVEISKLKRQNSTASVLPKDHIQKQKSKLQRPLPENCDQKEKSKLKRPVVPENYDQKDKPKLQRPISENYDEKEKSKLKQPSLTSPVLTKDDVQKVKSKFKRPKSGIDIGNEVPNKMSKVSFAKDVNADKKLKHKPKLKTMPKIKLKHNASLLHSILSRPSQKRKTKSLENKGVANKKVNLPKEKVINENTPVKICTEKEEFIVKEQKDDCNILIIRM